MTLGVVLANMEIAVFDQNPLSEEMAVIGYFTPERCVT